MSASWEHLVEGALGLGVHDLLQHAPVRARDGLGDAAAALQVELVHLLADVVPQRRGAPPDGRLEGADGRPCRRTQACSTPGILSPCACRKGQPPIVDSAAF